jgi:hypothetical protein
MLKPGCVLTGVVAGVLLLPSLAVAKDKSKTTLPYDVLHARTVRVIIDPSAGVSLEDPRGNQVAQRDVETAFLNWGRFETILDGPNADLIIVIRRGTGKVAAGTVYDPRQNRRPGTIDPTDTGVAAGVERGQPPPYAGDLPDASQSGVNGPLSDPTNRSINQSPHPQAEIGSDAAEDSFVVYRGKTDDPLDSPPVWRYVAKDCLKPHKVLAVDEFRKVIDQTEQAAAKQP